MNELELPKRAGAVELDALSWFPMQYDDDPPIFEVLASRFLGSCKFTPDAQA